MYSVNCTLPWYRGPLLELGLNVGDLVNAQCQACNMYFFTLHTYLQYLPKLVCTVPKLYTQDYH